MPTLTRWFIKTALVYLVVALLVGALFVVRNLIPLPPIVDALGPVYFHLFMVGWVTQLIIGVAYWMFPKFSMEKPRGSEPLGWAVFTLLNIGLALRAIGEPLLSSAPGMGRVVAVSAVLQWLAGMAFVANTWRRVKEK